MTTRRALLAAAAALPRPSGAAEWQPDRPVTMIVAFAAGGGTDTAARTLAGFMERDLGQSVVVVNRAGAGGEIGWGELARAKPDGHTIGFTNTPNIITVPIERQARFRFEDFAFIANIVDDPGGMWVLAGSPIASLSALVEEARRRPGEISYGTTGVGSDDHLAMLALQRLTGTRFLHVPFGGSSQVRTALLSRQLALAVVNMAEGVADWRQGLVRPLGAMAPSRWEGAAAVPTFREQGFDVVESSLRGVGAPAGLPRPVLDRLALSVKRAVEHPEFRAAAAQQLLPLRYLGPDEYVAELMALKAGYERLWREHPWRE
ncbi:tripartite tricarboxylate transporter substrate-binding protein [Craurococcus roseus]|uniref:Tripartite tricarboxylate transporter substrate-binding protein n=1 Tax=Craurococcus roseus TaxID=77585 RepID=A0ABN1EQP9_9PROT